MPPAPIRRPSRVAALLVTAGALACEGASGPPVVSIEATEQLPASVRPLEPPRAEALASPRVTVAASGDVLLHIKVNRSASHHANDGGYRWVLEGLRATTRDDEITHVNLETPLVADVNEPETGEPPVLGARAEAADALAWAGVDVVSCANNHAYDQDSSGLARTVASVQRAGMLAVGVGADLAEAFAHRLVERGGMRVAFLSAAAFVNRGSGERPPEAVIACARHEDALLAAIDRARAESDVVVLAIHWSSDYQRLVLPSQRRMAARWVERGVDLVVGTGPHLLQEVERLRSPRGDAVIAYSLGNLVSNQGNRYTVGRRPIPGAHPVLTLAATRDAVILRTTFGRGSDGNLVIEGLSATPLWTENNWPAYDAGHAPTLDIRIAPLASVEEPLRSERMAAIEASLGPAVGLPMVEWPSP